jgi:hypothetical protein
MEKVPPKKDVRRVTVGDVVLTLLNMTDPVATRVLQMR